ncbi:MAG: hypothetical protein GY839_10795 [candidate division Zixibacteria bacterium]|nr:hypothetical protein [candidate division Zixibacteria bacterium]
MVDKIIKEQEHHKKAFEYYYSLGEKRSHQKVATKMKVSLSSVKLWGAQFNWKGRVQQREAEVARIMATKAISNEVNNRTRNLQIVQMALVQLAKAIAEGKVKMTLADLDRLVRLESFLTDGYDSRKEILVHGITDKSNDELKKLIQNEIQMLKELEFDDGEFEVLD